MFFALAQTYSTQPVYTTRVTFAANSHFRVSLFFFFFFFFFLQKEHIKAHDGPHPNPEPVAVSFLYRETPCKSSTEPLAGGLESTQKGLAPLAMLVTDTHSCLDITLSSPLFNCHMRENLKYWFPLCFDSFGYEAEQKKIMFTYIRLAVSCLVTHYMSENLKYWFPV